MPFERLMKLIHKMGKTQKGKLIVEYGRGETGNGFKGKYVYELNGNKGKILFFDGKDGSILMSFQRPDGTIERRKYTKKGFKKLKQRER